MFSHHDSMESISLVTFMPFSALMIYRFFSWFLLVLGSFGKFLTVVWRECGTGSMNQVSFFVDKNVHESFKAIQLHNYSFALHSMLMYKTMSSLTARISYRLSSLGATNKNEPKISQITLFTASTHDHFPEFEAERRSREVAMIISL